MESEQQEKATKEEAEKNQSSADSPLEHKFEFEIYMI